MKATKTFSISLIILFLTFCTIFSATDTIFFDDFETSQGWVRNPFYTDDATTGMWERDNPEETIYDVTMQLGTTVSGEKGLCTGHLAGSYPGSYDIDDGKTTVRSPDIALPSDGNITLSFSYYLAHYYNATSDDYLRVKVVGSTTQHVLEELGSADIDEAVWETFSISLNEFYGQTIYILIEAADNAGASLVEAGVDDVLIEKGAECLPYPTCYRGEFWDSYGAHIVSNNDGGVGIGIVPSPEEKFVVAGMSHFRDRVGIGRVPHSHLSLDVAGIASIEKLGVLCSPSGYLEFEVNGEAQFNSDVTILGSLGLGAPGHFIVNNPSEFQSDVKINGELWARKVTVTLDEFPDFVFDKNFKLKPLEKLEQYVKENKRLPNIPSEREVKEKGLNIGEMQSKLLEQIEQITLYLFELKKENKELQEINKALEQRIGKLENK